ncbi:alpha/beta hydrolase family protein [uncultured Williamsia sp.]|uniref:alpha/beta hydrolase n=1 Tax=uncultured Williamsia sp. TaxID=259311 RepID=UPI0026017523|nr:alpha/beta hydrolase family protein [uncultured Williamsia sp.]
MTYASRRAPHVRAALSTLIVAMIAAFGLVTVGTGAANAWGPRPAPTFKSAQINGYGMPNPVIRTWASTTTNPAQAPTVIFLDGLRATNDVNGWEKETNVPFLSQHGYNVVMPVGGQSSFYADWDAPSPSAGQTRPYRWNSVLTGSLPAYLNSLGFSRNRTLVGLSMSAAPAIMLATTRPDLYTRAVSMSGFPHPTAPGMQTMLRAAAFDSGRYDLNDMWGIFPNVKAFQNDPWLNLGAMRGKHLWVYAAAGIWNGPPTNIATFGTGLSGSALEVVSQEQSQTFALAARAAGANVRSSFWPVGIHAWQFWQDEIWRIDRAGWFRNG